MEALSMPTYRVDFVDHGENVYYTEEVEDEDDKAVMEHMRRSYGSSRIGAGFDIWDGERLVHQHRD